MYMHIIQIYSYICLLKLSYIHIFTQDLDAMETQRETMYENLKMKRDKIAELQAEYEVF